MPHTRKKTFEQAIANGNHLLTQVKNNQPKLRRRLDRGSQWRRPIDLADDRTVGRNRWETRELKMFPAKAWFRGTPWDSLLNTVLRLDRTVWTRSSATGMLKRTAETVFWISSAAGMTATQWLASIRGHWRIENGSHHVRDTTFAEDASRIRINPDIAARLRSFAYNLLRASGCENVQNARWRAALDVSLILKMPGIR
jgi:predicted transposase YbfD/YdcC